jgi:hypothetical protein
LSFGIGSYAKLIITGTLREKLLHFFACSLVAPDLIFYRIILHAEVIVSQVNLVSLSGHLNHMRILLTKTGKKKGNE